MSRIGRRHAGDAGPRCKLATRVADPSSPPVTPKGFLVVILGVALHTVEVRGLLTGEFASILSQYDRAIQSLATSPVQHETAAKDAFGAVEAAVRLVTNGGNKFGDNVTVLMRGADDHRKAIGRVLHDLHAYRSQMPGAAHGRWREHSGRDYEVEFVVRTCGAAIVWLIEEHKRGV